ncbi:hypothetical protein PM082_011020 [Marasmius tenuissimus]|nr:hypothetical protein PM082_011020 [Marasmius tenuissimus]
MNEQETSLEKKLERLRVSQEGSLRFRSRLISTIPWLPFQSKCPWEMGISPLHNSTSCFDHPPCYHIVFEYPSMTVWWSRKGIKGDARLEHDPFGSVKGPHNVERRGSGGIPKEPKDLISDN